MPKASVVIPAYNAEKSIGQCIGSVLSQRPGFSFEVIVVDDGSTDMTAEAAAGFRGVRLLRQEKSGPAAARNNGAKAAKGKIVVFMDSDCVASAGWLHEMLLPFSDKNIAGVQGTYRSRQRQLIARLVQLEIERKHERMARTESIDFMGTYSAAYRKSVFDGMRGFDSVFPIASGEDIDLSFRMSKAGHKMVLN